LRKGKNKFHLESTVDNSGHKKGNEIYNVSRIIVIFLEQESPGCDQGFKTLLSYVFIREEALLSITLQIYIKI